MGILFIVQRSDWFSEFDTQKFASHLLLHSLLNIVQAQPRKTDVHSFFRPFEPGMDAGSFVLIAREGEWDEVLLITHHEGSEWLVY